MKKRTDGNDSDGDDKQKSNKDHGFQFETEARAAHRRQQQQPTPQQQQTKPPRKRSTANTSPTRRTKSGVTDTRDLTNTSSTHFQPAKATPAPANPEPKELTLSERLASIGRITSTLPPSQDESSTNIESAESKK
jgi:hypothetical protein